MKKIIIGIIMLASPSVWGQWKSEGSDNVFQQSEDEVYYQANGDATGPGTGGLGGDDPAAPIDDYLPVLMVAGVAIALYAVRQRQALLNK